MKDVTSSSSTAPRTASTAPPPARTPAPGTPVWLYLAGGALGLLVFFVAMDPSFLSPASPRWLWPTGDLGTYQTAGLYYVHDRWRLPLFATPAMGYPDGGSVVYNDALPIGALAAKLLYTVSGLFVNYLPWAMLAAYVLQGAMAVRLVRAIAGTRAAPPGSDPGTPVPALSPGLTLAIASWAVLSIIFLLRIVHVALTFQFLLLWALALYFEQVRARRIRAGEQAALIIVGVLTNPYILAMALLILAAIWIEAAARRALSRRDVARGVALAATLVSVAALAGLLTRPKAGDLSTGQHGYLSWNLVTLVTAPEGTIGDDWFGPITRDATGGQPEGESYLGAGTILVVLLCLLTRPADVGRALRRHWALCLVIAAASAFAASDQVYVGSHKILSLPLPAWAETATGLFRTQGRFVWPLVYTLTLAPIVLLLERRGRVAAVLLVSLVTLTKVIEAAPTLRFARAESVTPYPDLIGIPTLQAWMQGHDRVWQFPSWSCGGLRSTIDPYPTAQRKQIQLQLLVAKLGLPNNSIYMARNLKACLPEWQWAANPRLQPGTFYIFVKTPFENLRHLEPLMRTPACRDAGWAYMCSRAWGPFNGDPQVPPAAAAARASGRD